MTTPGFPASLLLLQAALGGSNGLFGLVIQFGLIIAIIYFVMFRPQQKQRQAHEASLKALKRGDEIVTAGGIIGEVIHVREMTKDGAGKGLEDRITIKSAESRLVVERGRIARIVTKTSTSASAAAAASDDA